VHGNTIHVPNACARRRHADTRAAEPLTYYYFGGPISEVTETARARRPAEHVAVVGLGRGALLPRHEGETWTFFEIDPEVVRLAATPNTFRFLSSCAPSAPVVLGDARLTLRLRRRQST